MTTREIIDKVHHEALESLRQGQLLHAIGEKDQGLIFLDQAYRMDRIVVDYWADHTLEPIRGSLHANVSDLAFLTGRYEDAVELASRGLTGNTTPEIRKRLIDALLFAQNELQKKQLSLPLD